MWVTTVQPWFVSCRDVTGFAVTLVDTYSETVRVQFSDVRVYARKLNFQANLCEVFAEDESRHCYGDLVLGWAVLQNTVFKR